MEIIEWLESRQKKLQEKNDKLKKENSRSVIGIKLIFIVFTICFIYAIYIFNLLIEEITLKIGIFSLFAIILLIGFLAIRYQIIQTMKEGIIELDVVNTEIEKISKLIDCVNNKDINKTYINQDGLGLIKGYNHRYLIPSDENYIVAPSGKLFTSEKQAILEGYYPNNI